MIKRLSTAIAMLTAFVCTMPPDGAVPAERMKAIETGADVTASFGK